MTTEAPKDHGTAKILGTVIALGAIGVGGYLIYDFIKKNSCSPIGAVKCIDGYENECSPWPSEDIKLLSYWKKTGKLCQEGCTNGDTRCYNNQSQVCQGGVWVPGGDACNGGGETPVLCIDGATRCQGADKIQCQDGEWKVIGSCSAADCVGITCVKNQVVCDEYDTAYYDVYCDPRNNQCAPTMYLPDAAVCKNAGPGYQTTVDVNGSAGSILLSIATTCRKPGSWLDERLSRYPDLYWHIVAKDNYGRRLENARIRIVCRSISTIGFLDPAFFGVTDVWDGVTLTCGKYEYIHDRSYTDSNGEAWIRALVMFSPDLGAIRTEVFDVYVDHNGMTYRTEFTVQTLGSDYGDRDRTCQAEWIGGNLCRLD